MTVDGAPKEAHRLSLLFGLPVVWSVESGSIRLPGAADRLTVTITSKASATPGLLGPPVGYRPAGAATEIGHFGLQVGRNALTVWPAHTLTDASWAGAVHARVRSWHATAESLGFEHFVGVYGWVDHRRLVVAGPIRSSGGEVGVRIVTVASGAAREPILRPGAPATLLVRSNQTDGEWRCHFEHDTQRQRTTLVATRGGALWQLTSEGGELRSAPPAVVTERPPVWARVAATLDTDNTYFAVHVERRTFSGVMRTIERWNVRNGEIQTNLPFRDMIVNHAETVRAGTTRLLALVIAQARGPVQVYTLGGLDASPWCDISAGAGAAAVSHVALGPDYVAGVATYAEKRYLIMAPIARGRERMYAWSDSQLLPGDPRPRRLELVCGPTAVHVLVEGALNTRVHTYPITTDRGESP